MAKKPLQGRTFERRNGQEGFAWEGIATKVDPAGNPPNRPRDLVNVRIQGGVIISRPNFTGDGAYIPLVPTHFVETPDVTENPPFQVGDSARWVPHWLGEHNSAAGVRLWWVAEPLVVNDFAHIGFLDTDADLGIQIVANVRLQGTSFALPIEKFNNEIYFGDFGGLRKLFLIPSVEGANSPPVNTDMIADEVIVSYPGFRTGAMLEHAGLLFFSIVAGGAGTIYSWDGLGLAQEFVMAGSGAAGMAMAVYKDTLVVSARDDVAPGQGNLFVRDATGAWTTHTLAGFNPSRYPNSMMEYGNLLYIVDSGSNLYTWDGTVIALAHTLPAGGNQLHCLAKISGRLYFSWKDTLAGKVTLGFVDQDSVPPNLYRDQGVRNGVRTTAGFISAMAQYRGRLWVAVNESGVQVILWHSQQFMPYDSWHASDSSKWFTTQIPPIATITNMRML